MTNLYGNPGNSKGFTYFFLQQYIIGVILVLLGLGYYSVLSFIIFQLLHSPEGKARDQINVYCLSFYYSLSGA